MVGYPNQVFCAADLPLLGRWLDSNQKKGYEFLEGFGPNVGVVLILENSKVKNIYKWTLYPDKQTIKFGYGEKTISLKGNNLILNNKTFQKTIIESPQSPIISLKKSEIGFIDSLTKFSWKGLISSSESTSFLIGFTNNSGLHSLKKNKEESLNSWSISNGILKIGGEIFPNAKITDNYLILLTSNDYFRAFKKGEKLETLSRSDLLKEKEMFIKKLTSGTWNSSGYRHYLYEYRPTFGDLSGSIFVYQGNKNNFQNSRSWEFSTETGILKTGYTEYINAKIIGEYLLLLNKNGNTEEYVRAKEFPMNDENHDKVKDFVVSEKESGELKKQLSRYWMIGSDKYIFTFKPNANEGFLHKFKSIPIAIRGNTFKTDSTYKEVRLWEDKIIFDKNEFSLKVENSPVFMKPIDKSEAVEINKKQKKENKELLKNTAQLIVNLKNGKKITLDLPVKSFSEINLIELRN